MIDAHGTGQVWRELLGYVLSEGQECAPRRKLIREVIGMQTRISMKFPIMSHIPRKLSHTFMFAEAIWILTGDSRVNTIAPFCKHISQFSDDGIFFHGAYGPKVVSQLSYIHNCFHRDKYTRQAVINIWRENPPESRDIPCTLSLQFLYRNNRLDCVATMRSSDIWLGYPYDVFNFSMISAYVLIALIKNKTLPVSASLGMLTLNAGSQHVYMSDAPKFTNVVGCHGVENFLEYNPMLTHEFIHPDILIDHLIALRDKEMSPYQSLKELCPKKI